MRRIRPDTLVLLLLCALAPLWLAIAYAGPRSATLSAASLPVMLPESGLYDPEPLADRPDLFRWTAGEAAIRPPNPGGPLLLRLSLASGFAHPKQVTLRAAGLAVPLTVLPGLRSYSLLVPPQPGERVALTIEAPTEVVDGRELGVMFHTVTLAGGGAAPIAAAAAMAVASLGAYLLLRAAGMALPLAGGSVLALQLAAAAWQRAGLWRYGLLGQLLLAGGAACLAALVIVRVWPATGARGPEAEGRTPGLRPPDYIALGSLLALALALCLPWLMAPDPVGDLELSARRMGFMYERGGFSQAYTFGGDYMPLRLYILRALSFLVLPLGGAFYDPVPGITHAIIKIPSTTALLLTVALLYWWARRYGGPRWAALIAGLYAVAPPVWMNVAWWGQVDVLLALPMVASVALLDIGRGRWSWLCWAVGVLIKPQAIIIAPLLYVLTLRRHGARGLAEGGALALGLIILLSAPLVLLGQGPGLYQAAAGSVGRFPTTTAGAYNLWWIAVGDSVSDLGELGGVSYRSIGLALVGLAALMTCLAALRRPGGPSRAAAAAALALAFFSLPTQIHERYVFFALPFLLLCAAADRRALLPFGLLAATATVNIVGTLSGFFPELQRRIEGSALPTALAWVNMALLVGLLVFMWLERDE